MFSKFQNINDRLAEMKAANLDNRPGRIKSFVDEIYIFRQSMNTGFLASSIIGLLFGFYGLIIAFPAWNKKMINISQNTTTFRDRISSKMVLINTEILNFQRFSQNSEF